MQKITLLLASLFLAAPAYAEDNLDAALASLKANTTEETIDLGNHRFLVVTGGKTGQTAYGIDLVSIDKNGAPHFEPILIEEYDPEQNIVNLSEGVGFPALNYHFDKATKTLEYTSQEPGDNARVRYKYQFLDKGVFLLQEVVAQQGTEAPQTMYKAAAADAQKK